MKLNDNQLKEIDEKGYVILPDCFSNEEINNLRKAMTKVFNEKTEAKILESIYETIESVMKSVLLK